MCLRTSSSSSGPRKRTLLSLRLWGTPWSPSPHANRSATNGSILFHGVRTFDNGAAISRMVVRVYFNLLPESRKRWPNPTEAFAEDSFFHWLNAPWEGDLHRERGPVISNLMSQIYRHRSDVQEAYPEPLGKDRVDFCDWFIHSGKDEHNLDSRFVVPVTRFMGCGDLTTVSGYPT